MGRTMPTYCDHGFCVDGGDFCNSERCDECETDRPSMDCYPEIAWPLKFRLPDGRKATTFFETKSDAETGKRILAYFDIESEIGNMVR